MKRKRARLKVGDERTVTFFAWLPVTVISENNRETRWLEIVTVKQVWEISHDDAWWCNVEFI
jgi:hypothetical protein